MEDSRDALFNNLKVLRGLMKQRKECHVAPVALDGLIENRKSMFNHAKHAEVIEYATKEYGQEWDRKYRIKKQPGGDYYLLARIGKRLPKDVGDNDVRN